MKRISKLLLCLSLLSITPISFAIPNPAAVNCKEQGLSYVMVNGEGLCVFDDGSVNRDDDGHGPSRQWIKASAHGQPLGSPTCHDSP